MIHENEINPALPFSQQKLFKILFVCFPLLLVIPVALKPFLSLAVTASILLLGVFFIFRKFMLYSILLTIFLEGEAFSISIFDARIRIHQIIACLGILLLFVSFFFGKYKIRLKVFDALLILYLGVNLTSLVNAPVLLHSIKIILLLMTLIGTYWLFYNMINSKKDFIKIFHFFCKVGILELSFGLYQFFAGVINYHFRLSLPIGHLGLVHVNFLGLRYGRPYGTLIEPDWFGAVALFYSLLFIPLYFSKYNNKKMHKYGLFISVLSLLLSFVRAAWVGFIVGCLFILYRLFISKSLNFSIKKFILFASVGIILLVSVIGLNENIRNVLVNRFSTTGESSFSTENVRFVQMMRSIDLFLEHPIIGNGTGNFSSQGVWGHADDYYDSIGKDTSKRYDPSLITTILSDTGVMGFFTFILLASEYYRRQTKRLQKRGDPYLREISFGLFVGVIGLFGSYVLTHGFWIPFTWVFLAFSMICKNIEFKDSIGNFR